MLWAQWVVVVMWVVLVVFFMHVAVTHESKTDRLFAAGVAFLWVLCLIVNWLAGTFDEIIGWP